MAGFEVAGMETGWSSQVLWVWYFTCMYFRINQSFLGNPLSMEFLQGETDLRIGDFPTRHAWLQGNRRTRWIRTKWKLSSFGFFGQRLPHKLQWQNQSHVSQTYNQIAWGWENLGLFCMGHSSWNWWKNRFQQSQSTRYFWTIFGAQHRYFFGFKHSQAMGIKKPLWIPNYWVNP